MNRRSAIGILALCAVVLSAAVMQSQVLRVGGISPNLLLVSLIVFSFFTDNPVFYAALVLLGVLFGRVSPVVFDSYASITAFLALSSFWFGRRAVWPGVVGCGIAVACTTTITYLALMPQILWHYPAFWLAELAYNVLVGLILFEVVQVVSGHKVSR